MCSMLCELQASKLIIILYYKIILHPLRARPYFLFQFYKRKSFSLRRWLLRWMAAGPITIDIPNHVDVFNHAHNVFMLYIVRCSQITWNRCEEKKCFFNWCRRIAEKKNASNKNKMPISGCHLNAERKSIGRADSCNLCRSLKHHVMCVSFFAAFSFDRLIMCIGVLGYCGIGVLLIDWND